MNYDNHKLCDPLSAHAHVYAQLTRQIVGSMRGENRTTHDQIADMRDQLHRLHLLMEDSAQLRADMRRAGLDATPIEALYSDFRRRKEELAGQLRELEREE